MSALAGDYRVTVELEVVVHIGDSVAIDRCVENHDDQGRPVPEGEGHRGWRDLLYDLDTAEKVLGHLAYNCIANGVEDAVRLDGWADLPAGTVTMSCDRRAMDVDRVLDPQGRTL